jgi:NAD(P)-dependent dehydrogenase (short-subunit alcohol dehydrogenase family)
VSEVSFHGQVAVVTGAGGGIGRTCALELARRGARVVANDLGGAVDGTGSSQTRADETVEETLSHGGEAVPNLNTVARPEGAAVFIRSAVESFGSLDILINSTGTPRDRSSRKLTADDWRNVMIVHLDGAFHVTQPAFEITKAKGHGQLPFTSLAAGLWDKFGQANDGTGKLALVGHTNVLAIKGTKRGIQSNVIAPMAASRMTEPLMGEMAAVVDPSLATLMALYLASRERGGGRFARRFVGVVEVWAASDTPPTVEEEARDALPSIRDLERYDVPLHAADEIAWTYQSTLA